MKEQLLSEESAPPTREPAAEDTSNWEEVPVGYVPPTPVQDDPNTWEEVPVGFTPDKDAGTLYSKFADVSTKYFADPIIKRATKAIDYVQDIGDPTGGLISQAADTVYADDIWDATKKIGGVGLRAVNKVLDLSDRMAGSAVATIGDAVTLDKFHLYEKAQERDVRLGLNMVDGVAHPRTFPVSLTELGQTGTVSALNKAAEAIDSDGGIGHETAATIRGVAPALGILGGVAASFYLDPLSIGSAGKLTEAGVLAEKAGTLSKSVAQQVENGERSLLSLRLPGASQDIINSGKIGKDAINKASEILTNIEMTKAGQFARKYLTKTGFHVADDETVQFLMSKAANEEKKNRFIKAFDTKSTALGLDLSKKSVADDVYKYFDNPSAYKGTIEAEKLAPLFTSMDLELKNAVENATAAGIHIPEKSFDLPQVINSTEDYIAPENLSSRYVPRGTTPDKRQQLRVASMLDDAEMAQKVFEEDALGGGLKAPSGKGGMGSFLKKRSLMTKDGMNEMIKEKYGIEDYFHSNPVQAYADKISDINQAVYEKRYVQNLVNTFASDQGTWIKKVEMAKQDVQAAKIAGMAPDPIALRLSKLRADDFVTLKNAKNRVKNIAGLSDDLKGVENLYLPGPVADLVEGILSPKQASTAEIAMKNYQRAFKNAMFFTPGFHIRNMWESVTRGMGLGTSATDMVGATRAILSKSGPTAKFLDEFNLTNKGIGIASSIEGMVPKVDDVIRVSREQEAGDNALKRIWGGIREMSARGTWDNFKSASNKVFLDNPLYRMSANVGNAGENIPKLAYFAKLRKEGYSAEQAAFKVRRQFLDYELTRTGVRSLTNVVPFANYMIKNAESVFKMMVQNPRNVAISGPGGAFERAVENWAGWDPGRSDQFKDMFGGFWAGDSILTNVLPSAEAVVNEKDLLKKFMYKWMSYNTPGSDGKPINELEGAQTFIRLPTSYHSLAMLNPLKIHEMVGPQIKALISLIGTDPFTGEELPGSDTYSEGVNRGKAVIKELSQPFIPDRAINAARALTEQMWPEYEKNLVNLGLPEEAVKTIFGNSKDFQGARKKFAQSIAGIKTLGIGGATKSDVDIFMRVIAEANETKKYVSKVSKDVALGRSKPSELNTALHAYMRMVENTQKLLTIRSSYEENVSRIGGTPDPLILEQPQGGESQGVDDAQDVPAESDQEFQNNSTKELSKPENSDYWQEVPPGTQ